MDELDKGNISAALGKQDKYGKAELSCATLGNKPNQKMPPLNLHTAAVYVALLNFLITFLTWTCVCARFAWVGR